MTKIAIPGATVYAASAVEQAGSSYFLCRIDATGERQLGVGGDTAGFAGQDIGQGTLLCPCSAEHAAALRAPILPRRLLDDAQLDPTILRASCLRFIVGDRA